MEPNRSPIGWALLPLKRYADFGGRSARAEFWWFFLFVAILYLVMWVVAIAAVGGLAAQGAPSMGMLGAFGVASIFIILFWLALLIPSLAVQTRRLHDSNRSGWWLVGFYALYIMYMAVTLGAGFAAGAAGVEPDMGIAAIAGIVALLFLVYAVVLLVFYCMRGTRGANRYGADPYGEDVADVFA